MDARQPAATTTPSRRTRLEHEIDARSAGLGVWLLRRTRGRLAGLWGRRALVLITRGRKTGRTRAVPVQYFPDGDSVVVVAANSGMPRAPGWFHNLVADPRAVVDVEGRRMRVRAEVMTAAEAAAFWPRVLEAAPDYARYPQRTSRTIPLVRLTPTGAATSSEREASAVTVWSSIAIARPPEVVFDYLTDIEREPEWNEALTSVEPLTPGPIVAGSRYRVRFPLTGESVIEYLAVDRPTRWVTTSTSARLVVHFTGRMTPLADGGCRVELRTRLEPRGALRLALPLIGGRMRRSWDRHLRVIKERLESESDTGI